MNITKERETMKCPKCQTTSFELRKAVITNYKEGEIYAACCVKCGTVLGMIKG